MESSDRKPPMNSSVRLCAVAAALLPFLWSVVVHSGNAPVPLAISPPERPALAFRQYAVDLGLIQPTSEARGTFLFVNNGKANVQIKGITPSCSCLEPRMDKMTFASGEEGRIVLRVQPANESAGSKELFADVSYSDPLPRDVRLTFKLQIPERQMTVTPSSLMFYHPKGSEPTTSTFTVADGRKKPFDITEVDVTSDLATAVIGERSVLPTGEWSQTVHVTVRGELPEGKRHALLRIRTNDLDYRELRVPLMLIGPTGEDSAGDGEHDHADQIGNRPAARSSADDR